MTQSGGARRRRVVLSGIAVAAVGAGGVAWYELAGSGGAPAAADDSQSVVPTVPVTQAGATTIRGIVRPAAWSRVSATLGGVASIAPVQVGDIVSDGQVLARVRALDGTIEVVSSPRAGTVTAQAVSHGDTILPGALLFVVSDVRTLRIEAIDVDEYVVTRVRPGQRATVAFPALEVTGVASVVRSVGPQPVGASIPDPVGASTSDHYPVTIDLIDRVEGLRIGMVARIQVVD